MISRIVPSITTPERSSCSYVPTLGVNNEFLVILRRRGEGRDPERDDAEGFIGRRVEIVLLAAINRTWWSYRRR